MFTWCCLAVLAAFWCRLGVDWVLTGRSLGVDWVLTWGCLAAFCCILGVECAALSGLSKLVWASGGVLWELEVGVRRSDWICNLSKVK